MNIRINDRINEIKEKEKTWNLTRDEVIIKEMYSCLVAISESLVTYTKDYEVNSLENKIREQLEKIFDKDIIVKTLEDIMDEVRDMSIEELPSHCITGDGFEEYLRNLKSEGYLSKERQKAYDNILDDLFDKGTSIGINKLLGDSNVK